MNKLSMDKQVSVIGGLVEGCSIRSLERMTGIHRDTIMRLSVRVGEGCTRLMDEKMRGLKCEQIQVDELWNFVGKKQRQVTAADDRAAVHRIIYGELVAGEIRDASREVYRGVIARLVDAGAQAIVLGCTEIMLLVGPADSAVPLLDTTTLHAAAAVQFALKEPNSNKL